MSGTPSASPFQPLKGDDPAVVGGYRLAAVLGSGGMGKVYLSYTPGGRPIAIKVIRPEFSEDPEFRRRFQQEVHSAQRVQGLYTAPVIDCDGDGTPPWLATAYVPGPSLAHAVAEHGALPLRTVLLLTVGVAEALHAIHAAGIVHRDLKPANVLLAADGPRVIDFGIARAADSTALTGTGVTVGTPSFMAPEQASAGTITPATDVFALGQIVAYAAIGSPAFGDGPSHAVLYRIVHEDPDLSRLPAELLPLVSRCLSRDPAERPTPAELIELCHELSPDPLRQGEDWLPQKLAGSLTERRQLPEPARTPPPAAPTPTQTPTHAPTAYSPPAPPPGFGPANPGPAYPPTQAAPVRQGPVPQGAPQAAPQAGPYYAPGPPRPGMAGRQPWVQPHMAPPQPPKRKRRGLIVLGVIAGLVVLSAILSHLPGSSDKDADKSNSTSTSGSSGTTGGNTGGTDAAKRPDPKPVTYKGINVTASYYVMLGDSPLRPTEGESYGRQGDLYYQQMSSEVVDQDQVGTGSGKFVLLNNAQKGSLAVCRAETRYADRITLGQLSPGSQICILSDSGHIAVATYRGRSGKGDPSLYVTFDFTIWRNAGEAKSQ